MNTIEQAHELLTEAREARTGSDAETSRHMSSLVLATLAVAEQQRIANLIAWTTSFGHVPNAAAQEQIREGLAL